MFRKAVITIVHFVVFFFVNEGLFCMRSSGQAVTKADKINVEQVMKISFGQNENDFFSSIFRIDQDEHGDLWALDGVNCRLYVFGENGMFKKSIGKKGDGPGEFQLPVDFMISNTRDIYVLDRYKIHIFNAEGQFIKFFNINKQPISFFVDPNKSFFLTYYAFSDTSRKQNAIVCSQFDITPKLIKEMFEVTTTKRVSANTKNGGSILFHLDNPYTPQLCFTRSKNRNFILADSTEYKLFLYNSAGVLIKTITRPKEKQSITTEEKDYIYQLYAPYYEKEWTKKILKTALQYPNHRPFIGDIVTDDHNRIYVRRLKPIMERKKSLVQTYDLFDADGLYKTTFQSDIILDLISKKYIYRINQVDDSESISIDKFSITNYSELFGQENIE